MAEGKWVPIIFVQLQRSSVEVANIISLKCMISTRYMLQACVAGAFVLTYVWVGVRLNK